MNILVVGGTRYMGRHLVKELIAKGHDVTIATRGITPDDFGDRISRLIVDRTSAESIRQNIPNITYDCIIDTIAFCSNDVINLLDHVKCKRYVEVSTLSVYNELHVDMKEEELDAKKLTLIHCNKDDFTYDIVKQQAECAIVRKYSHIPSARVRFPLVIGTDDYTRRLYFYVDHIVHQKPMNMNTEESQMAFVRSDEAGKFLAFLAEQPFAGAINGASEQTFSMKEVADYVYLRTGKSPVVTTDGETAPFNNRFSDYSVNVNKAKALGFSFTPLSEWIYELLDSYIARAEAEA